MRLQVSRKRIRFIILTSVVLLAASWVTDAYGIFEVLERKTIDMRMRICRSEKYPPSEIVLILIDESSLRALNSIAGRWPWPRDILADLIDFLSLSGVKSILMDIMFTEDEIKDIPAVGNLDNHGPRLVLSTQSAGNVFHAVQMIDDIGDEYNLNLTNRPMPVDFVGKFSVPVTVPFFGDAGVEKANNYYLPFAELYRASKAIGVVSFSPDQDGVFRSEKLLFKYQNHFFPVMSLAPVLDYSGVKQISVRDDSLFIDCRNRSFRVPLTKEHEYYVNMYGRFVAYSISGVLLSAYKIRKGEMNGLPVDPSELKDKIVFVGASAAGVEDLKHTSMASTTPGTFLHASILGNILSEDFLLFPGTAVNLISLVLLIPATICFIIYFRNIVLRLVTPIILFFSYLFITIWLFNFNIVVSVMIPSSSLVAAYFSGFAYIGFSEGKEKRKIKNILGQYVSPAMLETVLERSHEEYLKAEVGSREVLTVFFSDIREFTSIAERYEVEKVVEALNSYFSLMVNIIFSNHGTLDKFIGDAIMAFWGAPVKLENHQYKAVLSALQMKRELKKFNQNNKERDMPELDIGIGIHTGEVILGNIGSEKKLDYTIIGDSVNLASRIERLTKIYGCPIIISHDTFVHIKNHICCRMLDKVMVKGKSTPIMMYEVMEERERADHETVMISDLTDSAFKMYLGGDFEKSASGYNQILTIRHDDPLSKIFSERCRQYIRHEPPEGWNGCCVMETK